MYTYTLKLTENLVRYYTPLMIMILLLILPDEADAQQLWLSKTSISDIEWHSVAYGQDANGNGLFVAVARTGSAGNQVMTSPDGNDPWTPRTSADYKQWFDITYGRWSTSLRTMSLSGNVATLTTFVPHNFSVGQRVTITGVNSTFNGTYTIASVPSSLSFTYSRTDADIPSSPVPSEARATSGLFVAVASNGIGSGTNNVMTSPDGVTWTQRTGANGNAWNSVTYGNGLFVATATSGSGADYVMTSPDGINWTPRSAPSGSWRGVTFGSWSAKVSQKSINANVATLTTISNHNFSPNQRVTITGVDATFDGTYVILGVPTLTTFTYAKIEADLPVTSVSPAGTASTGLFVGVSVGGGVMTSPDGTAWTSRTPATANQWGAVVYGEGLFVAVSRSGAGNRVMTSTDGINWTSRSSADDLNWNDITYSPDGKFVAVATTGTGPGQKRVMSSVNGINWFSQTPAADNDWRGVTFGLNRFVAVGSSGTANRVMVTTFTLLSASLLSFQAAAKDCQADLEWKTASEVNTSHFEVESSSDGRNFRAIGRVEAQGNGNGRTYGFRAAQVPGRSYYRLKMADLDGKFTYSPVKNLTMGCAGQTRLSIYPNPLTQGASLSFRLSTGYRGNAKAELVTTEGRLIRSMALSVGMGVNNYSLSAEDLPAGVYTLRVSSEAGEPLTEPQRVIKR
jgi:predicted RecA/RadA family phage recombinase